MEISGWLLYLFLKADDLVELFGFTTFVAIVATVITGVFFFAMMAENMSRWDDDDKRRYAGLRKIFKTALWVAIIGALITTAFPNTKQLGILYVVPKVVNSEVVQKDIPELYDLGMSALKEKVSELVEKPAETVPEAK